MKKFRVISDLHLDINAAYPLHVNGKVFTVICGDTSGDPELSIEWIKKNIKSGIVISGNHLPYNKRKETIQELRERLEAAFPASDPVTYLDAECTTFSKEVDGILFIGTCMYSDMKISSRYNVSGIADFNMRIAHKMMNDFHHGIREKTYPVGIDAEPSLVRITPKDYVQWFDNAFTKIDALLTENEKKENPLPVVLVTHFPLIKDILVHSYYVDPDNFASYGSDKADWLLSHPSIKCYCCGHAHMVDKNFKNFLLPRKDGTAIRVVSNTRGYLRDWQDHEFNLNTFVDTETWEVTYAPIPKHVQQEKNKRDEEFKKLLSGNLALACFI